MFASVAFLIGSCAGGAMVQLADMPLEHVELITLSEEVPLGMTGEIELNLRGGLLILDNTTS